MIEKHLKQNKETQKTIQKHEIIECPWAEACGQNWVFSPNANDWKKYAMRDFLPSSATFIVIKAKQKTKIINILIMMSFLSYLW